MVRGLCDSMCSFLSPYFTTLPSLVVIGLVEEEKLSFQFDTWVLVITWPESNATSLWVFPHDMSTPCHVWWPYVFWREKYVVFSFSRDLSLQRGQRDMWLHGCVYFTISYQLARFCGHKPCRRGYIKLLIWHVQLHITTWSEFHVIP